MTERRIRPLEQRAAEDDVLYVVAQRQLIEEMEGEEQGPYFLQVELDLEGNPLVRSLIVREVTL